LTSTLRAASRLVVNAIDDQEALVAALQRLRDALERHEARDGFAETCWSVDDVLGTRPDWSDAQAHAWLESNAGLIQDAMVEAGWDAIDALMDE
jgi:hypothetical protein